MNSIQVTPTKASKITDVDFNNLGFGTIKMVVGVLQKSCLTKLLA